MFALVDHDPDGISIMSTYKYGSTALSHETNLAVPSLRWLGVKSDDIIKNQNRNGFNDSVLRGNLPYRISVNKEDLNGLLRLKSRDRRIAVQMLRKNLFAEDGRELEWRRELQIMLMLGVKAEIQILSERDNLENWLDEKLCEVLGFEGDCLMGNG
jgi:meiotic recombination protein SPO11